MQLSNSVNIITPSLTRKLYNMAQGFSDVIDFTLGDPDLLPPESVRIAGCKAIMEGKTRYSANAGLWELRKVYAKSIEEEKGITLSQEETIVTVGGMEAIYLALNCLLNPGDEVIIPVPYWVNYVQMVRICGGKPVFVNTLSQNGFLPDLSEIQAAITERTKLIIINSPNNPTGAVYPEDLLRGIAKLAVKHNFYVLSDEVYRTYIYNGQPYFSAFNAEGMRHRCILIDSMSKRFSMTGWRLGFAAAPAELISAMSQLQENVAACAPLPSQYAATEALRNIEQSDYIFQVFSRRRKVLLECLKKIPQLYCNGIDGTFYAFINIGKTGLKSEEFAYKLLEYSHVAVVPGVTYGKDYDDYIRIAFTLSEEKIIAGFAGIQNFIAYLES